MGISKEQLAAIIGGKARDLCSQQGEAVINEARRLNRDAGYYDEDPANYDGDADYYDSMYTSEVEAPTRRKKVGELYGSNRKVQRILQRNKNKNR